MTDQCLLDTEIKIVRKSKNNLIFILGETAVLFFLSNHALMVMTLLLCVSLCAVTCFTSRGSSGYVHTLQEQWSGRGVCVFVCVCAFMCLNLKSWLRDYVQCVHACA